MYSDTSSFLVLFLDADLDWNGSHWLGYYIHFQTKQPLAVGLVREAQGWDTDI